MKVLRCKNTGNMYRYSPQMAKIRYLEEVDVNPAPPPPERKKKAVSKVSTKAKAKPKVEEALSAPPVPDDDLSFLDD